MKSITLFVVLAVILLPANAYATCPDFHEQNGPGPQGTCSQNYYSFDTSCASTQYASTTTMSCYSWPGYLLWSAYSYTDYHMTVEHSSSCKDVEIYVDFSDPDSSSDDGVFAEVWVWHNGSLAYSNEFLQHYGNQGSMECQLVHNGSFSASVGDTIEVQIWGTNYHSASIKTTAPLIWD
jgi:hypothetical protein